MTLEDDILEAFAERARRLYVRETVQPSAWLGQRIMAYAWRRSQEVKQREAVAAPAPLALTATDSFLALAAAEVAGGRCKARELTSKSGVWTLRIFEEMGNPDTGYVVLEVMSEHAAEFEGKKVTVTVGEYNLLSALIEGGQAEGDVDLAPLDLDQALQLQID